MRPHPLPVPTRWRRTALALAAIALATAAPAAEHPPSAPGRGDGRPAAPVVAVFGDGYAEALADGLRADDGGPAHATILEATHAPSGLADASGYDWAKALRDTLARQPVDEAVIMLGSNDRAPLPDGAGNAAFLDPRWRVLYGERVEALAAVARQAGVRLVWVGLPVVADPAMAADFVALNAIVRDRATAAGATYVDTWDAFTDEAGRYDAFGPDAMGRVTRLRTADGLDFTQAGARKLASFVEPDLRPPARPEAAAEAGDLVLPHQPGFDEATAIDVNAQIRREAGLPALPGSPSAARPAEHGPVVALTAPVLADGGRLVEPALAPAPLLGAGGSAAERALVDGLPIPPRPGRTDDFSWPRR